MGHEGERRLLAIMFTDIKGYSAMVGADEARTLRVVTEHRALVREIVAAHGGTEHRTIGDAFLVLFDSALVAVRCAIALQERLLARNQGLPEGEQVWLRIGLHVGEVVYDRDRDVFGEAVNVAARVEPHAPPGGICFTDAVHAQVRTQLDRPVDEIGALPLKNIARPPVLYRLAVAPVAPVAGSRRWGRALAAVAVLVALVAAGIAWTGLSTGEPPGWPIASTDPEAQARFEEAMAAVRRGEDERARRLAASGLRTDERAPLLWLVLAATDPGSTEGLDARERALELAGFGAAGDLVRAYDRGQRFPEAPATAAAWDAWAEAHPGDEWGAFLRARDYPRFGQTPGVGEGHAPARLAELQAFVAAHPSHAAGRIALAQALRMDERIDEANAVLTDGLVACPECAVLHQQLGELAIGLGRFDEAEAHYRRAVEQDASLFVSRTRLADLAAHRGDEASRKARADAILAEETPAADRVEFATWHAQILYMHGQRAEGRALLLEGLEIAAVSDPARVVEILAVLAELEAAVDDPDGVRDALDRLRDAAAAPEVPSESRDRAALYALIGSATLAWLEQDARGAADVDDRLRRLPEERFVGLDREGVLRHAAWIRAALEGRSEEALAILERVPDACGRFVHAASVQDRVGDEVGFERSVSGLDAVACPATLNPRAVAHSVRLAELRLARGDRSGAEQAARMPLAMWPHPDPDLAWSARLAAVEQALQASDR